MYKYESLKEDYARALENQEAQEAIVEDAKSEWLSEIGAHIIKEKLLNKTRWKACKYYDTRVELTNAKANKVLRDFIKSTGFGTCDEIPLTKGITLERSWGSTFYLEAGDEEHLRNFLGIHDAVRASHSLKNERTQLRRQITELQKQVDEITEKIEEEKVEIEKAKEKHKEKINKDKPWFDKE